jgi:hypothetical protein
MKNLADLTLLRIAPPPRLCEGFFSTFDSVPCLLLETHADTSFDSQINIELFLQLGQFRCRRVGRSLERLTISECMDQSTVPDAACGRWLAYSANPNGNWVLFWKLTDTKLIPPDVTPGTR